MKTPVQEMFERLEQLRFAKDPISEIFKLKEVMLDKEKGLFKQSFYNGFNCCCGKDFDKETEHLIKNNTSEI